MEVANEAPDCFGDHLRRGRAQMLYQFQRYKNLMDVCLSKTETPKESHHCDGRSDSECHQYAN